ncbi:MAG: Gldg family protein [Thiolinea sp.]
MKAILSVCRKEFNSFFASPAAWLFLGAFLIVNLFIFFWAETFFARNIADLKPLFQWMPVLMIFLVAALTMRSWSEERRSGTLESLLTSPVTPLQLVLGKFFAALGLVALALLLTLPLPLTVALIGPLDWGPVIGGYLASLFLAAAYIAIGLYMSARTDNPIVALILTVAVAGVFYLIGSGLLTSLFGYNFSTLLSLLGTGSRFDSITRGVLDVRDLYYYLSIVGVFLALNLYSLERIRWAGNTGGGSQTRHKQWGWVIALVITNFVLVNVWLNPVGTARLDLTRDKIYSLSDATRQYMSQLQEPLLIRGYFSAKSHPLLEPLTPQIKDILKEYQVAGGDKVRVEFIDPHTDQALETEAADKYGIRPMPFRMASRYQSGVVNSYFDLVVAYGDQYETLSYDDLIEVKADGGGEPEVLLKNPEYAITRSIRKIASAYQAGGNVFSNLDKPLTFHGYISEPGKLPPELATLRSDLETTLQALQQQAGDKLQVEFADPDAEGGQLGKQLAESFGFGPQIASLIDPQPFWFYMVLEGDGENVQVPLPAELDQAALKQSIEAAVQRMSPGYLKTVTLVKPPAPQMDPMMMQLGMPPQGGKSYETLEQILADNVRVKDSDLMEGQVPADTDLLILLAPKQLTEKQLFAVDQFLMQGGSVVIASSPFDITVTNTLAAEKSDSGLTEWLEHNGLKLADSMVLDPQNAALPVPVPRQVGGLTLNEIQMMPYPHFPDVRRDGLNQQNPMTATLGQLTMNWASPLSVDAEKNKGREVSELVHSSPDSWTSDELNVLPDYEQYPDGFKAADERGSQLLAVAVKGSFESFFKGKDSPLLEKEPEKDPTTDTEAEQTDGADGPDEAASAEADQAEEDKPTVVSSVIERSSDSARIILLASNSFATDTSIDLASQGQGTLYTAPLEFMQNAVDWSLDDQGLMSIRSRAQFARTLEPMSHGAQLFWEYLNYVLAILGLVALWAWRRMKLKRKQQAYEQLLAEV